MECERTDPTDPLRQGDIVAAHPGTGGWNNPWTRFGVVLSADCDLAQEKTGPNFVYAPIVSHHTYLADVWVPSEAAKFVARGRDLIDRKLAAFDAKVTCRHIENWNGDGGAANVAARLSEVLGARASEAMSTSTLDGVMMAWQAVQKLADLAQPVRLTQTDHVRDLLQRLVECRAVIQPPSGDVIEFSRSMVENALVSLQQRADTWLIRELIGLDPEMTEAANLARLPYRARKILKWPGVPCWDPVEFVQLHDGKWVRIDQAPAVPPLDPQVVALLASDWLRTALERMEVRARVEAPPRPRNPSARRAARRAKAGMRAGRRPSARHARARATR